MSTPAELLAEVPIFAALDEQERAELAKRLEVVTAKAGDVLFNRGDPGDSLYVVRVGVVEIFFMNDTGHKIVLETARAGDFFGETSLLDGGPRTASAQVIEDLDGIEVDRGDLDELFRIKPSAAMELLTATGRRLRETANILRHTAARDINEETADNRTTVMRVADWISAFSGSLPFLFIHIGIFGIWIVLNTSPVAGMTGVTSPDGKPGFDPFPFGLLTMWVSLEAIILSVFVLLSQNRQVARDSVRNDIEYDVNLKSELEIAQLHKQVDHMHAEILQRFANLEKTLKAAAPPAAPPN
jgi:CRP/FNR family transcriptional regulator, cyclic AMP receptor protein